jgi:hypothetical protein
MDSDGAFAAKTHLASLLDRTERGESFIITRHGRPLPTWYLPPMRAISKISMRRSPA